MKELVISYQYDSGATWSPHHIFEKIAKSLIETYADITFTRDLQYYTKLSNFAYYWNPAVMGIENPETGKKIIISYSDNNKTMFFKDAQYGWNIERVVQVFLSTDYMPVVDACGQQDKHVFSGISTSDLNLNVNPSIFIPFTYPVWDNKFETNVVNVMYKKESSKTKKQKMVFRGFLWEPRLTVLNHTKHPEISYTEEKSSLEMYGTELTEHRCGLSLNGNAEICNRDIELMAMGVPVLRPLLTCTQTDEPLIPNVHYISFDFDRQPHEHAMWPGAPVNGDNKLVWEALVDRWESVKTDYEFLDYIGQNGKDWYEQNGKSSKHVEKFMQKVNLSLLEE